MRATLMYSAGDVRIENVPDAHLIEPRDALMRVTWTSTMDRPPGRPGPAS